MAKNPSTRWFWNDWRNDKGLQACSVAARGVWIELLATCAENGGYLLFNGRPPSISELARYVGVERRTMSRLLHELEEHNVFSRRIEDQAIFCRRMVREDGEKCARHKAQKNATGTSAKQPDLFDDPEGLPLARDSRPLGPRIPPVDSEPESESPTRATEVEENDPGESFERPAGAFGCRTGPRTMGDVVAGLASRVARPPPGRSSSAVERRAENPGGGGSIPPFGANCRPARAARPRPPPSPETLEARRKPAFVKFQLLPERQRRILAAARQFELIWGHQEMTQLDPLTKRPLNPEAFQRAIDGTAKLIAVSGWPDPAAHVLADWKRQRGLDG